MIEALVGTGIAALGGLIGQLLSGKSREEGDAIRYRIARRKILMDEAECKLEYLFRNEDVTTWDALLVAAAEAYVAMTCAYPITKSASQQETMAALWKLKLREARTVDGLEEPTEDVGDTPFLNVRR